MALDNIPSVQDALDTLHRYSFGARDEIASTDIAFLVERIRDEYLRLKESERQQALEAVQSQINQSVPITENTVLTVENPYEKEKNNGN